MRNTEKTSLKTMMIAFTLMLIMLITPLESVFASSDDTIANGPVDDSSRMEDANISEKMLEARIDFRRSKNNLLRSKSNYNQCTKTSSNCDDKLGEMKLSSEEYLLSVSQILLAVLKNIEDDSKSTAPEVHKKYTHIMNDINSEIKEMMLDIGSMDQDTDKEDLTLKAKMLTIEWNRIKLLSLTIAVEKINAKLALAINKIESLYTKLVDRYKIEDIMAENAAIFKDNSQSLTDIHESVSGLADEAYDALESKDAMAVQTSIKNIEETKVSLHNADGLLKENQRIAKRMITSFSKLSYTPIINKADDAKNDDESDSDRKKSTELDSQEKTQDFQKLIDLYDKGRTSRTNLKESMMIHLERSGGTEIIIDVLLASLEDEKINIGEIKWLLLSSYSEGDIDLMTLRMLMFKPYDEGKIGPVLMKSLLIDSYNDGLLNKEQFTEIIVHAVVSGTIEAIDLRVLVVEEYAKENLKTTDMNMLLSEQFKEGMFSLGLIYNTVFPAYNDRTLSREQFLDFLKDSYRKKHMKLEDVKWLLDESYEDGLIQEKDIKYWEITN